MNIQKTMLATALLAFLTGCGSSGGGSSQPTPNNEVKNDQATQAQIEKQKAEVQALKKQLDQAKASQKQAELKSKSTEEAQDLIEVKNNLELAQNALTKAESELKLAQVNIQKNTESNQALQEQLNKVTKNLYEAQQEKLLAEKKLNETLTKDKLMTRAEVLDFALHNGLHTQDSEEFADDFQNKPKSYVIDQLLDVHKIIAIKNLARRYGLPETDVRQFARENKNKTLEESTKILDSKKEEIAQKREALNKEVFELAKSKGLEEWEAHNFAYGRYHTDKKYAIEALSNYIAEKKEREAKINELINLAKEKGLEGWEAENFANANVDNERAKILENLNQISAEKEKQRLQNEKEQQIYELVEQYRNNYFSDNSQSDFYQALGNYQGKSLDEVKQELEKLKANRDEIAELAKPLADYDINADQYFTENNAFKDIEEVKQNLEKEKNRIITYKKGLSSHDGPDKIIAEGFTSKDDLNTTQEPTISDGFETGKKEVTKYSDLYNQKYSIVTGNYINDGGIETYKIKDPVFWESKDSYRGIETKTNNFPTEGRATYQGVAFDAKAQGQLNYTVDFAQRTGSGIITGLNHIGNITLENGKILKLSDKDAIGVQGKARANDWTGVGGKYLAQFFGPKGEEIAGKATLDQINYAPVKQIRDVTVHNGENSGSYRDGYYRQDAFDIGFGGTRGEIQK